MPRSTYVQKYRVMLDGSELPDVASVSGLGLGEEGSVEVPEVDLKVEVSDGVRKINPVTLRIIKRKNLKAFNITHDWWINRGTQFKDVSIVILDKSGTEEIHRYFYPECEIKSWVEEDQEMASPKMGSIEVVLFPYGADLITV